MGTDNLAYDVWAQIVYGARVSIVVGLCTAFFTILLGTLIGLFSGYMGGVWDIGHYAFCGYLNIHTDIAFDDFAGIVSGGRVL